LKSIIGCASKVTEAQAWIPTKAIIVLESACPEQVVKVFGSKKITAPPIYMLSAKWIDAGTGSAYLPHLKSAAYPVAEPELATAYGEIDPTRFVPLQLPLKAPFEAGVVARHYGATRCVYLLNKYDYAKELTVGAFEAGLRGTSSSSGQIIDVVFLPSGKIPADFKKELIDQADCIVIHGEKLNGVTYPGLLAAWQASVVHSPDKVFIIFGFMNDSLAAWVSKQKNVVNVGTVEWLPPPLMDGRFSSVGEAMFQRWSDMSPFDDRATLLYVTDMITAISEKSPHGEIASSEWVPTSATGVLNSGGTYSFAISGVAPTEWGFATGYVVALKIREDEFRYVNNGLEPDFSDAPSLGNK